MFPHVDNEDSDQLGRMARLIGVFAGHTCHFVGFVVLRLICYMPVPCICYLRYILSVSRGTVHGAMLVVGN